MSHAGRNFYELLRHQIAIPALSARCGGQYNSCGAQDVVGEWEMIAGQSPSLQWRENLAGQARSIDEAIVIARDSAFRVWEGILKSDEAIVAVLGHEMYELKRLRPLLKGGKTTIGELIAMTCPGNPGNLHDQAWEFADRLVEQLRKARRV